MARADEDLRVAEHTLTLHEDCPYRLVAYHAQQCAEKYIKAYLVLHRIDFPYTHNIARLLELCPESPGWRTSLIEAEELSPFAVTTRYPGEEDPVSEADARHAVAVAAHVRDVVARTIGTAEGR
jgi:HEPN domain-containing protein